MQVFDTELRHQSEWMNWEQNQSHHYAIDAAGALYPAKKIVSLATGTPVSQFIGGHQTNSYLEKRGFVVNELPRDADQLVLQFQLGAIYDRKTEINGPFGGNYQNGISKSRSHPAIFIFSGESGEQYGYNDGWNEDRSAYLYTGEGKWGLMTLTRNNLASAEHAQLVLPKYRTSVALQKACGDCRPAIMAISQHSHALCGKCNVRELSRTADSQIRSADRSRKTLSWGLSPASRGELNGDL